MRNKIISKKINLYIYLNKYIYFIGELFLWS